MKFLKHENIIQIVDILNPLSIKYFNQIYIVTKLMDADLRQTLKSNELSEQHISYFMFQLLSGLRFLHSADIVHRDLKPGNLLVTKECDLHICDFGLARPVIKSLGMTEYVTTRYYRAPQIILNQSKYSQAVDMWAVGCIMAELFKGKPLFPGNNYVHQVRLIISVIGTPSLEQIDKLQCDAAQRYIKNQIPKTAGLLLKDIIPRASPNALDLIQNLLLFDFDKRLTADQALRHKFFCQFQEFLCDLTESKEKFDFSFQNEIKEYSQPSQLANIVQSSQTLAEFKQKQIQEALKISQVQQLDNASKQEIISIEQIKQQPSADLIGLDISTSNNVKNTQSIIQIDFSQICKQQSLNNSKDSIDQLEAQRNDNKVTPKFSQIGVEQSKLDIESSAVKQNGSAVIRCPKSDNNMTQQQRVQNRSINTNNDKKGKINNKNPNMKLSSFQWNEEITNKIQRMVYQQMKEFYPEIFNLSQKQRDLRLIELDKMFVESIRNAAAPQNLQATSPIFSYQAVGGAGGCEISNTGNINQEKIK